MPRFLKWGKTGQVQIRLDAENAKAVKRESSAHLRIFKRRRSHADIVNMMVRDWVFKMKDRFNGRKDKA